MDFYYVTYTRQIYKGEEWVDTDYRHQRILVIARDINEATDKINELLTKVENSSVSKLRAVPNHEVRKCDGLLMHGGYDSFDISPIMP